ncbi:MAG: peptide ABC transporter substrate-binding protein, partial [Gammaproteobacteria bacterium]|nr:peptide ABC transporter substrate-binding protein [Gammaproteobacteria bacterium]
KLFDQMKNMPNSNRRRKVIDQMVDIIREDAPWIWGYNPKQFSLSHSWYLNGKPNLMAHNTLQYKRIESIERKIKRKSWNKPVLWPVILVVLIIVGTAIPAILTYRRKEHMAPRDIVNLKEKAVK